MQLTYRGVSYEYNPPAVEMTEGEVGGKYRGLEWRARTVQGQARSRMMAHQQSIKNRQQSLLGRSAAEVGLTANAVAHYWSRIQGKVDPGFQTTYDRSHVSFS